MTQIESRSGLRGIGQPLDEVVDDVSRVVRPGARFRVELERVSAKLRVVEALDRAVVEGDVRRLARLARLDREAVILARDEDATARPLEHGMVRTAVAERQLARLVAGRAGEELV